VFLSFPNQNMAHRVRRREIQKKENKNQAGALNIKRLKRDVRTFFRGFKAEALTKAFFVSGDGWEPAYAAS